MTVGPYGNPDLGNELGFLVDDLVALELAIAGARQQLPELEEDGAGDALSSTAMAIVAKARAILEMA